MSETATLTESLSPTRLFRAGRQRGARNVNSRTAKQNIMQVFEGLGGWNAMLDWARSNKDMFYGSVYPRMLATESEKMGNSAIRVLVYAPQANEKPLETAERVCKQIEQAEAQAEEK